MESIVAKKVSEQLKSARSLLVKVGWNQHSSCMPVMDGYDVFRSPSLKISSFCAIGAAWRIEGAEGSGDSERALDSITPDGKSIIMFNDRKGRTKAEVLAAYDAAIELARLNERLAGV